MIALIGLPSLAALAQPAPAALNARWHGFWQAGESEVFISATGFKTPELDCRWVSSRPKSPPKACVAFYDAGVPKARLTAMFDAAEREIQRQSTDKQNPISAADRKAMQDDLARNRRVLADVSDDVFRSVVLESSEMEGDCMSLYYIDKAYLYRATTCPYPEANTLEQYRQVPRVPQGTR